MARRFGDLAALGTVASRLWELQRVLVASPAYLARCGSPHKLAELTPAYAIAFLLDDNALTPIGP